MANLTFDGNVKVSWVTTISNAATPTAAELNAGTAIDNFLTPDGLETSFATASVDQSSLASTFDSMLAGRRTPTLSLTYKRFDSVAGAATAAESTLVYRASGFLVIRRNKASSGAYVAAEKVDVYTVQCGQPSPSNPAPNETQKATVSLFSTADPSLQVAVT